MEPEVIPRSPRSLASSVRVVTLGVAIGASSAMPVYVAAALGPRLKSAFAIDDTGLGLLVGVFFASSALAAWAGGTLTDRWDWKPIAVAGCGLSGAATIAAGAWTGEPWGFGLAMVTAGSGFGLAQPASATVLLEANNDENLATLFAVKQAGIPVATLLAGAGLPLIAIHQGWEATMIVAGLVPLSVAGIIFLFRMKARPRPIANGHDPVDVPPVLALTVAGAIAAVVISSASGFGAVAMTNAGIGEATVGILLIGFSLGGGVTRILGGIVVDSRSINAVKLAGFVLLASAIGYGFLVTGDSLGAAVGIGLAYTVGWSWPGLLFYSVVVSTPSAPGVAAGRLQIGFSVGNSIGPLLFGGALDHFGTAPSWTLIAVMAMSAGTLLLRQARTGRWV